MASQGHWGHRHGQLLRLLHDWQLQQHSSHSAGFGGSHESHQVWKISVIHRLDCKTSEYMSTWVHEYMGTWVPEYMSTWVHEYMSTWVHYLQKSGRGGLPRYRRGLEWSPKNGRSGCLEISRNFCSSDTRQGKYWYWLNECEYLFSLDFRVDRWRPEKSCWGEFSESVPCGGGTQASQAAQHNYIIN